MPSNQNPLPCYTNPMPFSHSLVRGEDDGDIHHGIAKRSVLPPLDMSTTAKPVTARPRVPQSPCSLISNLLSRVQSWVVAPQVNGFFFSLRARFSASTASAKEKICLGAPVTSGCSHLPGSMPYQPRLIMVLP